MSKIDDETKKKFNENVNVISEMIYSNLELIARQNEFQVSAMIAAMQHLYIILAKQSGYTRNELSMTHNICLHEVFKDQK